MLDIHPCSPVTRRRLRSGPAADHVDGFVAWLQPQGYRPANLDTLLRSLAAWVEWMQAAGFGLHEAPAGLAACAAELRAQPRVRPWRPSCRQGCAAFGSRRPTHSSPRSSGPPHRTTPADPRRSLCHLEAIRPGPRKCGAPRYQNTDQSRTQAALHRITARSA
jgi:hypothetical protein